MKQHCIYLQLRFEASQDVKLQYCHRVGRLWVAIRRYNCHLL